MMSDTDHGRLLTLTALASVAVALILIVIKWIAWQSTGSVGLLASLLDSAVDSIASILNLVAVRYALVPADAEHRFGHGKAEALAGLGQSAFIILSALYLLWQAINRLLVPQPLADTQLGVTVMLISIALTAALVLFQRATIRKTGSTAIAADWLHYVSDLVVNLGIIAALLLSAIGLWWADGVIGVVIAVGIFWSAWRLGSHSIQLLLDREISDEVRTLIGTIVASHEQALGFHDLRTRQSGYTQFIQLHIDMDANLSLHDAHALAERIEKDIHQHYPKADIIIHQDPVDVTPFVNVP